MSGFTPGPWVVNGRLLRIVGPRGQFIAGVDRLGGDGDANAHLIAAAPELYANAEFLCDRLRDLEGYDGDELLRQLMGHVLPALSRMEAALARARGEPS